MSGGHFVFTPEVLGCGGVVFLVSGEQKLLKQTHWPRVAQNCSLQMLAVLRAQALIQAWAVSFSLSSLSLQMLLTHVPQSSLPPSTKRFNTGDKLCLDLH